MRFGLPLSVVTAVVIALSAGAPTATADGPWRGFILDADTGRPLAGVLVLAVFYRLEGGWGGHSAWYYDDSSEVITAADGHFEIPSRSFWSMIGKELRFTYFKFGYGQWRYLGQGTPAFLTLSPPEQSKRARAMRESLSSSAGAQIELLPARTRLDQLERLPQVPADAPESHMPLTRKAYREALQALGLVPR